MEREFELHSGLSRVFPRYSFDRLEIVRGAEVLLVVRVVQWAILDVTEAYHPSPIQPSEPITVQASDGSSCVLTFHSSEGAVSVSYQSEGPAPFVLRVLDYTAETAQSVSFLDWLRSLLPSRSNPNTPAAKPAANTSEVGLDHPWFGSH